MSSFWSDFDLNKNQKCISPLFLKSLSALLVCDLVCPCEVNAIMAKTTTLNNLILNMIKIEKAINYFLSGFPKNVDWKFLPFFIENSLNKGN